MNAKNEPGRLASALCEGLGAASEASECPECYGKGWNDVWKKVAGHYMGREEFRENCEHCEGTGKLTVDAGTAECQVPPLGWRCTRGDGHEGPCAAVACPDDVAIVERGMQRLREAGYFGSTAAPKDGA